MRSLTIKYNNTLLFLLIILLFSLISTVAANAVLAISNEIYQGVTVGEIPVGGLSVKEAQEKIAIAFKEQTANTPVITAIYKDQKWPISAQDIDLNIEAEKLAQQAYEVGRSGNVIFRVKERYMAVNQGHKVPWTVSYNQAKMHEFLVNISKEIERKSQNAQLVFVNGSKNVIPEVIGESVDIYKTLAEMINLLNNHQASLLNITVNEHKPQIVAGDFDNVDGVIASYSSTFDAAEQNRTQNIQVAAYNINGVLLRPNEIFSFNKIVGLRLPEYGYKKAPGYINGVLVPDWGGGVCQVSSTLYNAVLLADLSIEERTAHFYPPGYVPAGQDATVADNLLDFRFKNTLSNNIYITSEIAGNKFIVTIFGKKVDNPPEIYMISTDKKILEPNIIIQQDPNLELGKEIVDSEGQNGIRLSTYRIKKINGEIVNQEWLSTDEFNPVDRRIRVGTKVKGLQK